MMKVLRAWLVFAILQPCTAINVQASLRGAPQTTKDADLPQKTEAAAPTPGLATRILPLNLQSGWVMDNAVLQSAVKEWCADPTAAAATYGHISTWDTSGVTDTSYLIPWSCRTGGVITASTFNEDISSWDMSSVTKTEHMFDGASSFNQPLGSWDMSSVNRMRMMFNDASSFNQPLGSWDVSSANNIKFMFRGASSFDQVLCWDIDGMHEYEEYGAGYYYFDFNGLFDSSPGSVNDACTQCGTNMYRVDSTTCKACPAGSFSSPTAGSSGAVSCELSPAPALPIWSPCSTALPRSLCGIGLQQ